MTIPALVWQQLDIRHSPGAACAVPGCSSRPSHVRGPSRPELARRLTWTPYCRIHATARGLTAPRGLDHASILRIMPNGPSPALPSRVIALLRSPMKAMTSKPKV